MLKIFLNSIVSKPVDKAEFKYESNKHQWDWITRHFQSILKSCLSNTSFIVLDDNIITSINPILIDTKEIPESVARSYFTDFYDDVIKKSKTLPHTLKLVTLTIQQIIYVGDSQSKSTFKKTVMDIKIQFIEHHYK